MAYYIVLDTETARQGGAGSAPRPWDSRVYDLGYVIVDSKTFEVVESRSLAIIDTFANVELMRFAYYADKLPQYFEGMRSDAKEWEPVTFKEAYHLFKTDVKRYNVRKVWAYNCDFDHKALDATLRTYSRGYACYWLPYGCEWRDIWDYASCITATPAYLDWCAAHGFFSPKGNPKTTAEAVYGFLTDCPDYVERHTALEDAKIETAILAAARKKHKKTRHTVGQGWKDASTLNKQRTTPPLLTAKKQRKKKQDATKLTESRMD